MPQKHHGRPNGHSGLIRSIAICATLAVFGSGAQACTSGFGHCVSSDAVLDRLEIPKGLAAAGFEQETTEDATIYSLALGNDDPAGTPAGSIVAIEFPNEPNGDTPPTETTVVSTDVPDCDVRSGEIDFLAGPNGSVRDTVFVISRDGQDPLRGRLFLAEISGDDSVPPISIDAVLAAVGAEYCLCQGAANERD